MSGRDFCIWVNLNGNLIPRWQRNDGQSSPCGGQWPPLSLWFNKQPPLSRATGKWAVRRRRRRGEGWMYTYVHAVKPGPGADLVLLVDLECPHLFPWQLSEGACCSLSQSPDLSEESTSADDCSNCINDIQPINDKLHLNHKHVPTFFTTSSYNNRWDSHRMWWITTLKIQPCISRGIHTQVSAHTDAADTFFRQLDWLHISEVTEAEIEILPGVFYYNYMICWVLFLLCCWSISCRWPSTVHLFGF